MTHLGTQPIETARLRLRRLEPEDAGAIFEMLSDERTVRFLRVTKYSDIAQVREYITKTLDQYERPDYYRWTIELKDGGYVGEVSLYTVSEGDEVGGVGYSVTPAMWGNGYMPEALRAVLGFALKEVGYNRVEAYHSTQNSASGAVMRKAGMLYEGMMREKFKNVHGYHDSHLYGILKKDY